MKSTFLKLSLLGIIGSTASLSTVTTQCAAYSADEHHRLDTSLKNVIAKFEKSLDLIKELAAMLSPKSKDKLPAICAKFKTVADQADAQIIDFIRDEIQKIKGTKLEHSNYGKLLHTLLAICTELKTHFNKLHNTLQTSLQGKPNVLVVAKQLKPAVDSIITDANFKRIDTLLADAHKWALPFNNTCIEIKPQYRTILDIKDANPALHKLELAKAFTLLRESLSELHKECKKPTTISQAEILRLIREKLK